MHRLLLPLPLLLCLLAVAPLQAQDPVAIQRHRQRMLELFHRLDHDGDGRLNSQEVGGYPRLRQLDRDGDGVLLLKDIAPLHEPFLGERLLHAFRSADYNGDGLLTPQECAALPGLQSRFARFDRNADGLISMEELMHFRRSLSPRRRR